MIVETVNIYNVCLDTHRLSELFPSRGNWKNDSRLFKREDDRGNFIFTKATINLRLTENLKTTEDFEFGGVITCAWFVIESV